MLEYALEPSIVQIEVSGNKRREVRSGRRNANYSRPVSWGPRSARSRVWKSLRFEWCNRVGGLVALWRIARLELQHWFRSRVLAALFRTKAIRSCLDIRRLEATYERRKARDSLGFCQFN